MDKCKMVMKSFLSDWRPATSLSAMSISTLSSLPMGSRPNCSAESEDFLISGCYGMGNPLDPSKSEGNREGGGFTRP